MLSGGLLFIKGDLMNCGFRKILICVSLLVFLSVLGFAQASAPASVSYTWKNVQIVGGGFVPGIIFHPTAKGVRYARTDMGGAYRWNDNTKRWDPILDWIPYKD